MASPNVHDGVPAAPVGDRVVVLLAGVDADGNTRVLRVDSQGRLVVVPDEA
jgi:hypothetical protein